MVVRWTASGTSKGNFYIFKPSGKIVEYTGISIYRIENGKIIEIWETRNTFVIMQQINPKIANGKHNH